jgi:hypothetical protein
MKQAPSCCSAQLSSVTSGARVATAWVLVELVYTARDEEALALDQARSYHRACD